MTVKDSSTQLWIDDKDYYHIRPQLNNAYLEWKNQWPPHGAKYVWFEHHAEMVLGIKCEINYDSRIAYNVNIIDEEKYLMFMLKYS